MKMKGMTTKLPAIVYASVFLILIFVYAAEGYDATLGFPEKTQEHSEWCWAGSSQAVLEYYGSIQTQCAIANFASGKTTCCDASGFSDHDDDISYCNYWDYMWGGSPWGVANGDLQGILANWGVNSSAVGSYLSQSVSVSEIDAGRPFVMRFGWYGGGGHFLDGFGYDNNAQYLHYMDPWPGNGFTLSLYSWVVSAYHDHDWTHTLQITTNCSYAFAWTWDPSYGWRTGNSTLQSAYDNSATGYSIYARSVKTTEQFTLDNPVDVKLIGGCGCSYHECNGVTRLKGKITIKGGSVKISNIVIE
jgi:hypothetical protein